MAWPDNQDLPIEVEAAFGADVNADPGTWSWTDLTSRLSADPIRIRAGRSSGAGQVSPGTCTVTLDNNDAALTPLHPMSPYWPNVELGTPLRVRLRRAEDAFARTVSNGWGAADSGQAWTTVGVASDYSVSGGVARHSHTAGNLYRRTMLAVSLLDTEQLVDVTTPVLLTGAALVTGVIARFTNPQNYYWLRCEMNAGGTSIQLKITKMVANVETQLSNLDPLPGITYSAGTPLRIRASVVGTQLALKVWPAASPEPAGWQVTATDSDLSAPGMTAVQTWLVGGNTNTLPLSVQLRNYTVRVDRFAGYADQWQPTYLTTTTPGQAASQVQVTASGILRRLSQGDQPVRSALRRAIGATSPAAYWPGEEGSTSSGLASAVSGHPPLASSGTVEYVPVKDFVGTSLTQRYGSSALVDLSAGGMLSTVVPREVTDATATSWVFHVRADVDPAVISGDFVVAEWTTPGGTFVRWRIVVTADDTRLIAYTASGTATTVLVGGLAAGLGALVVTARQSGGNITITLEAAFIGSTSVAGTLTGISSLIINPTGQTASDQVMVGHIAIWPTTAVPYDTADAGTDPYGHLLLMANLSWRYETAHLRLVRLCAEDGVPLDMPAVSADGVMRMGWQEPGAALDLYRECEAADLGILHELGYGLAYLPRQHRYNRPVALTIDLAAYVYSGDRGRVLVPARDDQGTVNRMQVDRVDGSSAVADDADHQRRGVYSDSVTLPLADDSRLSDQAGWRVHLGTVEEMREATFPIDLAGNPDLIDGWLSCRVGSRIVRTNPPDTYPPGMLDRLVEGWTETIGSRQWQVQVTPSPAGPWDVATVDGPRRVGARGSTLAADIDADDLTLSVTFTADNGSWQTDPDHFPVDLRIGGEQVTATAITGTTSPQTVTLSARAVNGVARSWPAGTVVDVWAPAVLAL